MQAVVCPVQRCAPCAIHGKRRCALVAAQQATYYLCSPAGGCHRRDGQTVRARHRSDDCAWRVPAKWSGVLPRESEIVGSAPRARRHCTTPTWPHALLTCKAVRPRSSRSLTPTPPCPTIAATPLASPTFTPPPLRQAEVLRCDRYLCSSHEGSVWCPGGRGSLICRRPLHPSSLLSFFFFSC